MHYVFLDSVSQMPLYFFVSISITIWTSIAGFYVFLESIYLDFIFIDP